MPLVTSGSFLGWRSKIEHVSAAVATPVVFSSNGTPTQAISGSSQPANRPATVNAGDFLVMFVQTQALAGTTGPAISTPAGWTRLTTAAPNSWSASNAGTAADLFYKVAGAGEPATWTVTSDRAAEWQIYVSRFTGNDPVSPFDQVAQASLIADAGGNTIWNTPTVTPSAPACGIVSVAIDGASSHFTYTPPAGTTKQIDDFYVAAGFQILMGNGLKPSAAPTGAIAWTHTGGASFPFFGVTFSIKPKVS